ncbi:MAG: GntR family transcriptional regulator [Lachnospiraceae bacterium]|nr:GntR family transcriptional regulator [Lachnospiraceae bacterium]
MHVIINNSSMIPVYEQLVEQIRQQIMLGELKEGEGLPSVRSFAAELKISALTVKKAYDKLEEDGLVITVHGKGTYVAATDTGLAAEARRRAAEEDLSLAVSKARLAGLDNDEIREILEMILEEE